MLALFLLGHIMNDALHNPFRAHFDHTAGNFDGHPFAVAPQQHHVRQSARTLRDDLVKRFVHARGFLNERELHERLAQQFRFRIIQQGFRAAVDIHHIPLVVHQQNGVAGVVHQAAIFFFRLAHVHFGAHAVGNVEHHALQKKRLAGFIAHHRRIVLNPHQRAVALEHPILGVEGLPGRPHVREFGEHLRPIRGMNLLLPQPGIGMPRRQGKAEQGFDLRADVQTGTGFI